MPATWAVGVWRDPVPIAVQSYATIRLHDAWARFCRALVLLSGRGRVITLGGTYVPCSPITAQGQSVLAALRSTYPQKRQTHIVWEPRWFDPAEAIDAANRLRVGNFPTISAGLGVTGYAVDDLRACRNFLVHRNETTYHRVDYLRARLGVGTSASVEELLNAKITGGAVLFHVWCAELLQRASLASQ